MYDFSFILIYDFISIKIENKIKLIKYIIILLINTQWLLL